MCIEFAFKRGGVPLIRNFLHQSEGVYHGFPTVVQNRMNIAYTIRAHQHGKVIKRTEIRDTFAGFATQKGDRK